MWCTTSAVEFNGSGATANYNTNAATGNRSARRRWRQSGFGRQRSGGERHRRQAFTVTWTKGVTGTNTLIVIRAGAAPSGPTDMNSYAADPVFGSGSDLGSGSYVVYTNTGTSVTVTGLTPGTRYYIKAYAFNGGGGSENYRTSDPPSTDAYTLMPEPTTQASGIGFSSLGSASYAVSYTAGNGLSRLVVARQGNAVEWTPTDGTAYTGENNTFGAGRNSAPAHFLVTAGRARSRFGLSARTDYHIRISNTRAPTRPELQRVRGERQPEHRYTLSVEPRPRGDVHGDGGIGHGD
jgi:hypothetical protein